MDNGKFVKKIIAEPIDATIAPVEIDAELPVEEQIPQEEVELAKR